jgi:hypothetical protein
MPVMNTNTIDGECSMQLMAGNQGLSTCTWIGQTVEARLTETLQHPVAHSSRGSKLEAAPGDLGCLLNPLYGVLAAIVDNVCVEAHELLPAALLVALEVVAAGALVGVTGMSLADTVRDVGTLTKRHREG